LSTRHELNPEVFLTVYHRNMKSKREQQDMAGDVMKEGVSQKEYIVGLNK